MAKNKNKECANAKKAGKTNTGQNNSFSGINLAAPFQ